MKPLALAVIVIALMLMIAPVGLGAPGDNSPIATPTPQVFASPIGTPYPTAIELRALRAH